MITYRVITYRGLTYIEEVEVDKATEHNVWINGRRRVRSSNTESFFDTFEEAYLYSIDKLNERIRQLRSKLADELYKTGFLFYQRTEYERRKNV